MKKRNDYLFICVLQKICDFFRPVLGRHGKSFLFSFLKKRFEILAIESYLSDRQDIGFFENFILGSEENKKMYSETQQRLLKLKKAYYDRHMIQRRTGETPFPRQREHLEEEKLEMEEYIFSKKLKVVQILQEKDEIIKYLGRRIVTANEKIYQKFESLYNFLSPEL